MYEKEIFEIAAAAGYDTRPLSIAMEVRQAISSIKDESTEVEFGSSPNSADLWVTIGGVEYLLTIRLSNKQVVAEGGEHPWPHDTTAALQEIAVRCDPNLPGCDRNGQWAAARARKALGIR